MTRKQAYEDTLHIINGACNPVAVANTLAEWITQLNHDEVGMDQIKSDPAVILILSQLNTIIPIGEDQWIKCYHHLHGWLEGHQEENNDQI